MDAISYKTKSANKATIEKNWLVVDAEGKTLGRLASQVTSILRGKNKTSYTPHTDCGDHVIVVNAEKVRLTGNKWEDKEYIRHTGYPGGQRFRSANEVRNQFPERLVENAVKGMLPHNSLGRQQFRSLHVVVGPTHKHEAQNPKAIELDI